MEMTTTNNNNALWTQDDIKTIKDTVCKGASDSQLKLFEKVCAGSGLNPFTREIYGIINGGKLQIMTSIDGYRIIAARSGKYRGQAAPLFCGPDKVWTDVWLEDAPPAAAKVGVYVDGHVEPTWEVATMKEYGKNSPVWKSMPTVMLAKCFDEETEVLTEYGFKKFKDVNGRIMQVSSDGMAPVHATPFSQSYYGDMITYEHRDLDFNVTPNHDMITTSGRIEAGTMYQLSTCRPSFFIPRIAAENKSGLGLTRQQCELAGAYVSDADTSSGKSFRIKVSRSRKIKIIKEWNLHTSETISTKAGKTCISPSGRMITTKSDQISFKFPMGEISKICSPHKRIKHDAIMAMSSQEARWLIDSWVNFDGNGGSGGGENRSRRIWTSDINHVMAIEVLAIKAGYSVSRPVPRKSDIGSRDNYTITLSDRNEIGVQKWGKVSETRPRPSVKVTKSSGKVWCVSVPSGTIIVRRNGYSMLCGNCAESRALRKALPDAFKGIYTKEEMPAQYDDSNLQKESKQPAPNLERPTVNQKGLDMIQHITTSLTPFFNKMSKYEGKKLYDDALEFMEIPKLDALKFLSEESLAGVRAKFDEFLDDCYRDDQ